MMKKIVILLFFLILAFLVCSCSSEQYDNASTKDKINSEETPTVKSVFKSSEDNDNINGKIDNDISSEEETQNKLDILKYQIVYIVENQRADKATCYYILIDEIDLSDNSFKNDIEAIIKDMVNKKGKKLSIEIHDHLKSLEVSYKQYGDKSLGRFRTDEEDKIQERHYIAAFSGELSTGIFFNTLYYFLNVDSVSAEVGKYADIIEFTP